MIFKDPAEYQKYRKAYDAYTDWYNKYATLYAEKQDKKDKIQTTPGNASDKLPDPSAVPAGVDPVAWRKYCIDTREYHAKYKTPNNYNVTAPVVNYGAEFDNKKAMAERIADRIMSRQ